MINLLLIICLLFALAACSPPAASFTTLKPAAPSPTAEPAPTPTPLSFGLPNIYLFILDEYSSFDMLQKYYGYDNKVFSDFLLEKGFNISKESYSTDRQTDYSICDTLNLDYISKFYTTDAECYAAIDHSRLNAIFSDLGYSRFQYSSNVNPFINAASLKTEEGQKAYAAITSPRAFKGIAPAVPEALSGSLSLREFGANPDTPALNEWGFYPSDYIRSTEAYAANKNFAKADALLDIFDWFEDPNHYAPTSPRVIYSYMAAVHVPFMFDEYGGIIPFEDSRNWMDENVYLGQYRFISKRMMAAVSTIIANDPGSIIIIMSDHGIRYHDDCDLKHKFYITDKDSLRIMNAVYIKGEKYDIEGLSAINTLRFMLSLYDGHAQDYPPIKDPITPESPDKLTGIIPEHK